MLSWLLTKACFALALTSSQTNFIPLTEIRPFVAFSLKKREPFGALCAAYITRHSQ